MDAPHDTEKIDDLSALAWVHDELRRSLETAHKSIRRYLKEAEALAGSDVDAVDPGVLRAARAQLHQGVGALELVGLPAAAQVLRANEAALHKLSGRPVTLNTAAADTIEHASFALLDYLARLLADKPVSPLALFPQYRAVQELAGADRIHPADLWLHDWQWREVALDTAVAPYHADSALRSEVEAQTLDLMRKSDGSAAAALSELFAGLAAGVLGPASGGTERRLTTLWQMASAFFEAQAQGLLQSTNYTKRVTSRLLAQLRISERADGAQGTEVSQRLAQDLLFFCAQAASPGDGRLAPRLAAVRSAWNLARRAPVDYLSAQLGRFEPAWVAQAKKRVVAAKEGWAAVGAGELHRLSTLNEQFQLVGESLRKLYPNGEMLAQALGRVASQAVSAGTAPKLALAMEVATAVLYLEASLEDADFDQPGQAERVRRLAQRVVQVQGGANPDPLDGWMEELYRRVSDRQTMGSVVHELRGTLTESEKAIDGFFRQPAAREQLHPVPGQLNAMRGVFSVLGLEHASHAVVRMRDDVDMLAAASGDTPDTAAVERLASNLGALGFLIDMLSVQPAMAKSLFTFDAASGLLRSAVGGSSHRASEFGALNGPGAAAPAPVEPRLIEQAQALAMAAAHPEVSLAEVSLELERLSQEAMVADQPVLAETMHAVRTAFAGAQDDNERQAVRDELAQAMADFVHTSSEPAALDAIPPSRPMPLSTGTPTPAGKTGLEEDDEMREIFLEEAREVIVNAERALVALVSVPDDLGEMTTVRRAFHTLKGSSRMVGLTAFGEAAWSCEQLYNRRLADNQPADGELLALTTDVLAYLGDWVEAIGLRRDGGHTAQDIQGAVDTFGINGQHITLGLPGVPVVLHERPLGTAAAAPRRTDFAPMTMPQVSAPIPLLDLLPDLPSAETLGLRPRASAIQPLDELLAPDAGMAFELDLGEAAAMPVAGKAALQATAEPERASDWLGFDASSGMMSLDMPEAESPSQLEAEAEPYKMIGPLRVGIPLFNIFLNEADEQSRRLSTELAEWAHELHRQVADHTVALAHSLAGNSATVGFADLSHLARLLEHALTRSQALQHGDATEAALFNDTADQIRHLLHQFAAGFLTVPPAELVARLIDHERHSAERLENEGQPAEEQDSRADPHDLTFAPPSPPEPPHAQALRESALLPAIEPLPIRAQDSASLPLPLGQTQFHALSALSPVAPARRMVAPQHDGAVDEHEIDAVDAIDAELFPIFEDEALELLPELAARMREWAAHPGDAAGPAACMRALHTLKGGARLAGAMRLGERAHRLESAIDRLAADDATSSYDVEMLLAQVDAIGVAFDTLRGRSLSADSIAEVVASGRPQVAAPVAPFVRPGQAAARATPPAEESSQIDWKRFAANRPSATVLAEFAPAGGGQSALGAGSGTVRVRAPLLDRLVNHAGEVSITRSRIDTEVSQMKASLAALTENLERLRHPLRAIELHHQVHLPFSLKLRLRQVGLQLLLPRIR